MSEYWVSKKDANTSLKNLEYQEFASYGHFTRARLIIQNQKELIDNLSANVIRIKAERNKNLLARIGEAKEALGQNKQTSNNPIKSNIELLSAYEKAIKAIEEVKDDVIEPYMEDRVTVLTDTHGDALSLLSSILKTGAVRIIPNKYLYLDFTDGTLCDSLKKISEGHKIMLLPKLELNTNFKGRIVHLGDLIDRGAESALSLALAVELHEVLGEQIDFVVGNHEVTSNNDGGADCYYNDELKVCIKKNVFKPSVTLVDGQGNKTYLSHDQFTKSELPVMARVFADMMSNVERNNNEGYTVFRDKLLEIVRRKNSKYNSLFTLFKETEQQKKIEEIRSYIENYQEDKEDNLYLIRDLFIETHIEVFGETGMDYSNDLSSAYPGYICFENDGCGAFFIGNRNTVNKDTAFKRRNVFGHTTQKQATQNASISQLSQLNISDVENYTCIDTERSSGNSNANNGKDYTISEDIVMDMSGQILYSEAFAISRTPGDGFVRSDGPTRDKTHTIMSPEDENYVMYQVTKGNSKTLPRDINPGLQTPNKYRNLSSLSKILHSFWSEDEVKKLARQIQGQDNENKIKNEDETNKNQIGENNSTPNEASDNTNEKQQGQDNENQIDNNTSNNDSSNSNSNEDNIDEQLQTQVQNQNNENQIDDNNEDMTDGNDSSIPTQTDSSDNLNKTKTDDNTNDQSQKQNSEPQSTKSSEDMANDNNNDRQIQADNNTPNQNETNDNTDEQLQDQDSENQINSNKPSQIQNNKGTTNSNEDPIVSNVNLDKNEQQQTQAQNEQTEINDINELDENPIDNLNENKSNDNDDEQQQDRSKNDNIDVVPETPPSASTDDKKAKALQTNIDEPKNNRTKASKFKFRDIINSKIIASYSLTAFSVIATLTLALALTGIGLIIAAAVGGAVALASFAWSAYNTKKAINKSKQNNLSIPTDKPARQNKNNPSVPFYQQALDQRQNPDTGTKTKPNSLEIVDNGDRGNN